MLVNVLTTGDDVSEKLKTYCNGLPDVDKKVMDAASDEKKTLWVRMAYLRLKWLSYLMMKTERVLLKTTDMSELEKFFS